MLNSLIAIKNTVSGLLSKFIGYSLESIATFAKWTLLIGGLVFAVDVIITTIKSWFDDIMKDGEASKKLFGQYFQDVKEAATKFKAGMDGWDWNNISKSLADLLVEPIKILGEAIKAAIIDGIGTIIQSIGIYTESDTIKDLGTSVRASSVEMRQQAGRDITPEGMLVKTEDQVNTSKDKVKAARDELEAFQKYDPRNDPEMALGMLAVDKLNPEMKAKHDEEEAMLKRNVELAEQEAEEAKKRLELLKDNQEALIAATNAENAATKQNIKNQAIDKSNEVDTIIDKENPTAEEREIVDSAIRKSESDFEAGKLSEEEQMKLGNRKQRWESKITATPENPSAIERQPSQSNANQQATQTNNTQVNNSTTNNTVVSSVQQTPIKPMVSIQ
ncbi:hypothetical protein POP12_257 [Pectobacterium phage POP12]|nr:hypothetical protein POP12_257 [Pectobacterium phage POP12]